jgi:hypothetical protein
MLNSGFGASGAQQRPPSDVLDGISYRHLTITRSAARSQALFTQRAKFPVDTFDNSSIIEI